MKLPRRGLGLVMRLALAGAALSACGPSAGQVREARSAHYKIDGSVVFRAVVNALSERYKIADADAKSGTVVSEPRWYEADGTFVAKSAGSDNIKGQDRSIQLAYVVRVVGGADGGYSVEVTPHARQFRNGYAALFPLEPADPAMPGWVAGITDDLYVHINAKLKPYQVKPGA